MDEVPKIIRDRVISNPILIDKTIIIIVEIIKITMKEEQITEEATNQIVVMGKSIIKITVSHNLNIMDKDG